MLVSGDLEETVIPTFTARYANTSMLDVDVWQVAHHGSHNGTTAALHGELDRDTDLEDWRHARHRCRSSVRCCISGLLDSRLIEDRHAVRSVAGIQYVWAKRPESVTPSPVLTLVHQ